MFKNRTLVAILTLVVVLSTVLTACAPPPPEKIVETVVVTKVVEKPVEVVVTPTPTPPPPPPPKMPPPEEGLVYILGAEPPTFDINLATDTTSHMVINQMMESLYNYRPDGTIEPAAAERYEVSEDGRTYTIYLRKDLLWHDGVPCVAQHFVDGMIRLAMPETAAEYAWLMYFIEGFEELNTADETTPELVEGVGIKAIDDYTLQITLKEPLAFFPSILAFFTTYPIRKDLIEKYGDVWFEAGYFVGNGPYKLVKWEHEAEVVIEKFEDWHDADKVKIEKVTFPIVVEPATQLAMYEAGEVHSSGYPSAELPRILEDPVLSKEFVRVPRPGVYYLGLNTLREPTDDPLMRKALASAIDKRVILDEVLKMTWRKDAYTTIPPEIPGFQEDVGHFFDVDKAKAYLEEYMAKKGYEKPEDIPIIRVWFNKEGDNIDIIEAVTSMWEDNLGVRTEMVTWEWKVYLDTLDVCNTPPMTPAECEYNAYRMGWVMDYGDPNNMLNEVFAPGSPFQYTGWENERFTELMELGLTETDMEKRIEYYKEADKIACEDVVMVIPLFYYDRTRLIKSGIHYEFPPFGAPYVKDWYFE